MAKIPKQASAMPAGNARVYTRSTPPGSSVWRSCSGWEPLRPTMRFRVSPHHLWAVCRDVTWVPSLTAMPARRGSRGFSIARDKFLIHGGELVTKLIDESVKLTQVVIV